MQQNLIELGKKFKEHKDRADFLKAETDANNEAWDSVEKEMISLMLEDCLNAIDIEGVGKISIARKSFLSVNAANKPQFYAYLKESGNGSLLKEDVNPRTLGAFLKEHRLFLTKQFMEQGMDKIDAEIKADEYLKEKGASHFSETGLQFRKS